MLKKFNITAILVFLISMSSINHAAADGHVVELCSTPYTGVTHDECLTAMNKGVKLYQNCDREGACADTGQHLGADGLRTRTDNSIKFLYDGKWFNIRRYYDRDERRVLTQCLAYSMTPCTD